MFENVFSLNVEKQIKQLCFVFKTNHFHKRVKINEYKCFYKVIRNNLFDKHSIQMNKFLLNFLL